MSVITKLIFLTFKCLELCIGFTASYEFRGAHFHFVVCLFYLLWSWEFYKKKRKIQFDLKMTMTEEKKSHLLIAWSAISRLAVNNHHKISLECTTKGNTKFSGNSLYFIRNVKTEVQYFVCFTHCESMNRIIMPWLPN